MTKTSKNHGGHIKLQNSLKRIKMFRISSSGKKIKVRVEVYLYSGANYSDYGSGKYQSRRLLAGSSLSFEFDDPSFSSFLLGVPWTVLLSSDTDYAAIRLFLG